MVFPGIDISYSKGTQSDNNKDGTLTVFATLYNEKFGKKIIENKITGFKTIKEFNREQLKSFKDELSKQVNDPYLMSLLILDSDNLFIFKDTTFNKNFGKWYRLLVMQKILRHTKIIGNYSFHDPPLFDDVGNKTLYEELYLPNCYSIGEKSFFLNNQIDFLNLPKVKIIKDSAFYNNIIIKKIYAPNLMEIEDDAFIKNKRLTKIDFPNLLKIHSEVFKSNEIITTLYLPRAIFMGDQVFLNLPKGTIKWWDLTFLKTNETGYDNSDILSKCESNWIKP